jgi:hypothetical protein
MSFWDVLWLIVVSFAFVAYLMVMFSIITDLFRDSDTSGALKAVWVVALIVLPLITSLVYLVTRGRGMAERSMRSAEAMRQAQDAYIRDVAGKAGPADQIAQARGLLDTGAITQQEFDRIKEKALV